MTYIVIDLEWNQARSNRDVVSDSVGNKLYGEIIQIGAVKLDDSFKICDELKINVRPKYYKVIHRKVRQITGINQEDIEKGEEFRSAMRTLREWCGEDFAFLTWGPDDIRTLRRNIEIYGDDSSWINTWFNLQTIYNMQTGTGDNQKSLSTALESFEISVSEPMHDAFNDAYYTALIARRLDVEAGIRELARLEKMRAVMDESHPILCEVYSGYKLRRNIFSDKEASEVRCPECGKVCTSVKKWLPEKNNRYMTIAMCEEHGSYVARMTLNKENDVYNVSKVLYEAGGGAEAFYEKCKKKAEVNKKRKKRKTKRNLPNMRKNREEKEKNS